MKPRHRAWLIDLDGTLYDARWVKLLMVLELGLFGWRAFRLLRQFRKQHELLRETKHSPRPDPFALQLETTAQVLGADPLVVRGVVEEWMFQRPGKWLRPFRRRELLQSISDFREGGGKTALVSDYPARIKLEALGVSELFDEIVASGEPGGPTRLKPDPEGYLLAAERLEVPASECLVLGDRADADGVAAARAKMDFRRVP